MEPSIPQASRAPALRPVTLLRDTAIVWALTFAGGVVVGLLVPRSNLYFDLAIACANFVCSVIGFTVSGCWARAPRWPHLLLLALCLWLASAANIVLAGASIAQWVAALPFIGICMGIGGGVSHLLRK